MLLTLALLAHAQVTNGDTPDINAQAWRASVDSQQFLWMTDSALLSDGFSGRALLAYTNRPLTYQPFGYPDVEETVLLEHLLELDLVGAYTNGPVRMGMVAPLYLRGTGDAAAGTGLGDLVVDAKFQIVDRHESELGAAMSLRATLPTATVDLPVGSVGPLYEIEGAVDRAFGDTLVAVNVGHRGQPRVELENGTWGDQFYARVGAAHTLDERSGLGAEWILSVPYTKLDQAAIVPSELMLEGWHGLPDSDLVVRGGIGLGLGNAIGIPTARAVIALSWQPIDSPEDLDGDGIVDAEDACPADPEDVDGFKDEDGCADLATVRFEFVDQFGDPVPDVRWVVGDLTGSGVDAVKLNGGEHEITAHADGAEPTRVTFTAPGEGEEVVEVVIQMAVGSLVVRAEDADGNAIDGATWVLVDDTEVRTAAGESRELKPGSHTLRAEAEGYRSVSRTVEVVADTEETVVFKLDAARVEVTKERIEIEDSVYFETDKAIIRPDSYDLLDEVAEILVNHPELTKVRIEGHTDSSGADDYNLQLSKDRARAVRDYLVEHGVEIDRLEYEGYGETRPLVEENTAADMQTNRRVDFVVVERTD